MKNFYKTICLITFFVFFPIMVNAATPVLFFSDITSGPKTGLGDGLGEGSIVTVWGHNLGSSQGASKIYCGGVEAAHVYYWENADPTIGNSGPADLYSFHKMQEIAFSIDSDAPDGNVKIKVVVDGDGSNELDFYIRSGKIYFVKATGNNSNGDGSWANPWLNVDYYSSGACSKAELGAGDIIYAGDGVTDFNGVALRAKSGTGLNNPIALVAYPGADYRVGTAGFGIGNNNASCAYWNFSKIFVQSDGIGIGAFKGMRVVGCEITDIVCAQGASGAISGAGNNADGGIKCFGNYIHDFGGPCTTSWHHVFYLSNRSGNSIEGYELGWNYLHDNDAYGALHVYDEGMCGGWTGIISLHDNVVVNQVQEGFGVSLACNEPTGPEIEVYNNLFINCASNGSDCIGALRSTNTSNIQFYNNTIYGYGSSDSGRALYVQANGNGTWNFGGTWAFYNNIIVDTKGRPFEDPTYADIPNSHGNNAFYSIVGGVAVPSWAILPKTDDPLLVNGSTDFSLRPGSPCVNSGTSTVSAIVNSDIIGIPRPQGGGYDIGAYEYNEGTEPPPPVDDTTPPTGSIGINSGAVETENATVTLNLSASDSQSGVSQMQLSNNNVEWSNPETYGTSKSWTIIDGLGTKTVYAKFKDGAGNWSVVYSDTIELVDNAAPGDVTAVSYSIENESLTLNWTNPRDADFKGTMVRYGASAYPVDHTQGVLFCDRQTEPGERDTHTGAIPEGTYYFSFFTYDQNGNYSQTTHLMVIVSYTAGETYTKIFGDFSGSGYPGTIQDTFININTDINFSSDALNTYTWPEDQVANAILMKVALAAIPTGAQVQSAVLYVYMNGFSETGGDDLYDVSVHKIINHNPQLSQCTGYTYDGTNSWTVNTSCYNNVPMAQADIAAAEDNKSLDKTMGYKSWNITGMVQDWIANPDANFGLLLNSDSIASSSSNRTFASSEASDMNQRPKLEITYTTSGGTPPPSSPPASPAGVVLVE